MTHPSTTDNTSQAPEFDQLMGGVLFSLLSWQQLADFWAKLNTTAGWYLYALGEPLPHEPSSADQVAKFIKEIDALLRRDHRESYCGIVYADDLQNPRLVKIYDPNHLGSSCGSSKNPPLPGWIMSRTQPAELKLRHELPANRKRWWQALFSDER